MEIDYGIIYFGLTRSIKKVYETHINHIFDVLKRNNKKYTTFLHTWSLKDGIQNVWSNTISQRIDYEEYKLLNPDFYQLDSQEEYLKGIDITQFFNKDNWEANGDTDEGGEWYPRMINNHLCAIESQKRGIQMVKNYMNSSGNIIKNIIFIRPDVDIYDDLPINNFILDNLTINIQDKYHGEGLNDRFSVISWNNACIYANRAEDYKEFKKIRCRITGEKLIKYIVDKYSMKVNQVKFDFDIIRP
jgi:hypothetical protein